MIINSPFPNPIALMIREFRSVECVALFVIDKLQCGMLRVRWCDIVVVAHVSTECKTGYKMIISAAGTGNFSLSQCHTKISFEECNVKLERGGSLKPRVISDILNESCSDCVLE